MKTQDAKTVLLLIGAIHSSALTVVIYTTIQLQNQINYLAP